MRAATWPWPAAHDAHLTNLERQSFFGPREGAGSDLLASEAHSGQRISINTGQTINPDLDVHPTGVFTISPRPTSIDVETRQSLVVYDPEGHALSTITKDRLSLLFACFNKHRDMHMRWRCQHSRALLKPLQSFCVGTRKDAPQRIT